VLGDGLFVAYAYHPPGCEGGADWPGEGWYRIAPGGTLKVSLFTSRRTREFDQGCRWHSGIAGTLQTRLARLAPKETADRTFLEATGPKGFRGAFVQVEIDRELFVELGELRKDMGQPAYIVCCKAATSGSDYSSRPSPLVDPVENVAPVPINGLLKSLGGPGGDFAATKDVGPGAAVRKRH
jgi:hypothetical protein